MENDDQLALIERKIEQLDRRISFEAKDTLKLVAGTIKLLAVLISTLEREGALPAGESAVTYRALLAGLDAKVRDTAVWSPLAALLVNLDHHTPGTVVPFPPPVAPDDDKP